MDKIEQLWIRACKSRNPGQRVMSVHRRFYCAYPDNVKANQMCVTGLLSQLVDKYRPYKTSMEIIDEVAKPVWQFDQRSPQERAFHMVINRLAMTKAVDLPGLTRPLSFRLKYGERQDVNPM